MHHWRLCANIYKKCMCSCFYFTCVRMKRIVSSSREWCTIQKHLYNEWKYQEGNENAHKIVKTQEERTRRKKKPATATILNKRMQDTYSRMHVCVCFNVYFVNVHVLVRVRVCIWFRRPVCVPKESCILQSWAIKTQNRYEENKNEKQEEEEDDNDDDERLTNTHNDFELLHRFSVGSWLLNGFFDSLVSLLSWMVLFFTILR